MIKVLFKTYKGMAILSVLYFLSEMDLVVHADCGDQVDNGAEPNDREDDDRSAAGRQTCLSCVLAGDGQVH